MVENGHYIRTNSESRKTLAKSCLDYYGLNEGQFSCYIFPSGMSAVSSLLTAFAGPNKRYLIGDELYADCSHILKHLVQTGQLNGYDTVLQDHSYDVAYYESCSNPHGKFPDYNQLQ